MKSLFQVVALIGTLSVSALYASDKPQVELHTNKGVIVIELMPDKAPKSVENFLNYVKDGFYDKTIIHRVIPDYVIQGGGYDDKQTKKESTHPPVPNEADNGVKNTKGTVAVARKTEPHSGTSQFFINMKDNNQLNHTGKTDSKSWGYAVFGKVIKGMDILEQLQDIETHQDGPFKYFPIDPIIIESATFKETIKDSKKTPAKEKKPDAKLEQEDKKSNKKNTKDSLKEDEQIDAADKTDKPAEKKVEKKADKKSDKKTEKKSEDDQAAKDAAEDAADAAADKAAEKDKKDVKKVETKKSEKPAEKSSEKSAEKKDSKTKTKEPAKDADAAPDEPAAE